MERQKLGFLTSTSIIGLVVEFVVAIDEARVRFTDDAFLFVLCIFIWGIFFNGDPSSETRLRIKLIGQSSWKFT